MEDLSQNGWPVDILWLSGHADMQGIEQLADNVAKAATAEAAALPQDIRMITTQIKGQSARKTAISK